MPSTRRRPSPRRARPKARPAAMLLLERGAEDPGQRADLLGDQVVVLHEALDGARRPAVAIAQAMRDLGLQVEGQALLGAPGQIVQVTAHRPEKAARPVELAQGVAGQHAVLDQVGGIPDPVEELAEPEQGLQVAQAALAFLDVGLEQIAAVAGALVPGVALGELGLDEHGAHACDHLALEALAQPVEGRLVAPQEARLEQAGADPDVGAGKAQALVDRAGRLADLEAQVPQLVEQELDHLLAVRRALVGVEEQEVDVGVGRQLAAAVAADRDDREPLAGGRVGEREDVPHRVVEQRADQGIDQPAALVDHRLGVVIGLEAVAQRRLMAIEPGPQVLEQRAMLALAVGQDRVELGAQLHAVDARHQRRVLCRIDRDRKAHRRRACILSQRRRPRSAPPSHDAPL